MKYLLCYYRIYNGDYWPTKVEFCANCVMIFCYFLLKRYHLGFLPDENALHTVGLVGG